MHLRFQHAAVLVAVLCVFVGCAMREWEAAGFTPQEVEKWRSADFVTPEMAQDWKYFEFSDPQEARSWRREGFNPYYAREWRHTGLNPKEAAVWQEEFSPQQALEWKDAGFDLSAAKESVKAGFLSPASVQEWKGMTLTESAVWRDAGFTPLEADEWRSLKWPGNMDLKQMVGEAGKWRGCKFSAEDAAKWSAVGLNAQDAKGWQDAGFEPAEAVPWAADGVAPDEAARWRNLKLGVDARKAWCSAGVPLAMVQAWIEKGFELEDSRPWRERGFSPTAAAAWRDAGFNVEQADPWSAAGFAPKSCKLDELRAPKSEDDEEAGYYEQRKPDPQEIAEEFEKIKKGATQAAAWRKAGYTPQEASDWKSHVPSLEDAGLWKKAGYNPNSTDDVRRLGCEMEGVHTIEQIWPRVWYPQFNRTDYGPWMWDRRCLSASDTIKEVERIKGLCPKGVEKFSSLRDANPYNVKGRCFFFLGASLQVLSRSQALFNDKSARSVFLLDFGRKAAPPTGAWIGLVKGMSSYTYHSVGTGTRIVPYLKVIRPLTLDGIYSFRGFAWRSLDWDRR